MKRRTAAPAARAWTAGEFRCNRGVLERVSTSARTHAAGLAGLLLAVLAWTAVAPAQVEAKTRVQEGRVVDVLGEPVPAARLDVVVGDRVLAHTFSDAEGFYALRAAALSGAELRTRAPGKAIARRSWGGLSVQPIQTLVLDDACAVSGVVVDRFGNPVAGATVTLVGGDTFEVVVTDADGSYRLDAAPMRRLHVRAWGETSFAESTVWPREPVVRCDLELPPTSGGRRRVRVEGLPAEALADATLELVSYDLAVRHDRGRFPLGADGTAEFVPGDTGILRLRAPGYVARPKGWLIDVDGSDGELVFAAAPRGQKQKGVVLRGRLIDPDGKPIVGADLVVENRLCGHVGSGASGPDGRFVIRTSLMPDAYCRIGIELGRWQFEGHQALLAIGSDYSWHEMDAEEKPFTLAVEPATALLSEVRDENGNRFAFGEVYVAPSDRPQALCAELCANRLGAFALGGLEPGEYMLAAISTAGDLVTAEVVVDERERRVVKKWRREPSGGVVGRVVDADGKPVPGVRVRLASPEQIDGAGMPLGGRPFVDLRTDRAGRFACRGLQLGDWRAFLPEREAVEGEDVEVRADQRADVTLKLPAAPAR